MLTIKDRINELVAAHGSLREVSRTLNVDVAYLSRLRASLKTKPSDNVLAKLKLCRLNTEHYVKIDG